MSLNKTLIEWVKNPDGTQGYTWNPMTGCLNHVNGQCKGGNFPCYAYRLANGRLKERYLANENVAPYAGELDYERNKTNPFYPRFWPERLEDIKRPPYPFTSWTGNAPHTLEWTMRQPPNYHARRKRVGVFACDMGDLFGIGVPEDWTRQILDAISVNSIDRFYLLTKQSQNLIKFSPFPPNCYVGVSVTRNSQLDNALKYLRQIEATVKFISFEPLLERINLDL